MVDMKKNKKYTLDIIFLIVLIISPLASLFLSAIFLATFGAPFFWSDYYNWVVLFFFPLIIAIIVASIIKFKKSTLFKINIIVGFFSLAILFGILSPLIQNPIISSKKAIVDAENKMGLSLPTYSQCKSRNYKTYRQSYALISDEGEEAQFQESLNESCWTKELPGACNGALKNYIDIDFCTRLFDHMCFYDSSNNVFNPNTSDINISESILICYLKQNHCLYVYDSFKK